MSHEFITVNRPARLQPDKLPFLEKKWFQRFEAESAAELRIIPDRRMHIERKMRTVDRQVVLDQEAYQLIIRPGPGMTLTPKKPVMSHEQVGAAGDRLPGRGQ